MAFTVEMPKKNKEKTYCLWSGIIASITHLSELYICIFYVSKISQLWDSNDPQR